MCAVRDVLGLTSRLFSCVFPPHYLDALVISSVR